MLTLIEVETLMEEVGDLLATLPPLSQTNFDWNQCRSRWLHEGTQALHFLGRLRDCIVRNEIYPHTDLVVKNTHELLEEFAQKFDELKHESDLAIGRDENTLKEIARVTNYAETNIPSAYSCVVSQRFECLYAIDEDASTGKKRLLRRLSVSLVDSNDNSIVVPNVFMLNFLMSLFGFKEKLLLAQDVANLYAKVKVWVDKSSKVLVLNVAEIYEAPNET